MMSSPAAAPSGSDAPPPGGSTPTERWDQLKLSRRVMRFKVKTPKEPPPPDKVRWTLQLYKDEILIKFLGDLKKNLFYLPS